MEIQMWWIQQVQEGTCIGYWFCCPKISKDHRHDQLLFLDSVLQDRSGSLNIPSLQKFTENEEDTDYLSESAYAILVNEARKRDDNNVIVEHREIRVKHPKWDKKDVDENVERNS